MQDDLAAKLVLMHPDDEARWNQIADFVRNEPTRALQVGVELSSAPLSDYRALGADILGQLVTVDRAHANQVAEALLTNLALEDDVPTLASMVYALGHSASQQALGPVLRLASHADEQVRLAVAFALPSLAMTEPTVAALESLSRDSDPDVRDWATFALAESDLDDDALRAALADRLNDAEPDTRAEAMYGLARRRDPRARPAIDRELASGHAGELVYRASEEIAGNQRAVDGD